MSIEKKKKEIAVKMIQHTHYDRKLGKYIRTMVPQSKEHAEREKRIDEGLAKFKEPSEKEKLEYQKKTGRAYSE